jgi:hypothetical protein
MPNYAKALEQSQDISEIFELVKSVVREFIGRERSGLMLGLSELGGKPGMFVGGFYPVGSNLIVMNKTPLRTVQSFRPELFNSYCFHILLHEYLHTIGFLDEEYNRHVTALISEKAFGRNHPVTIIAKDFNRAFPEVMYASLGWRPSKELAIEIVENFDQESVRYIG